uniref:Uncharacterized protein n=1 Tax=Anguilla anguilla TaxID=7936 RepID=A0A0E9QFC9_ANGAN
MRPRSTCVLPTSIHSQLANCFLFSDRTSGEENCQNECLCRGMRYLFHF